MRERIFAVLVAMGFLTSAAQAQPANRADCLRLGQVDSFSGIRGNERAFIVTDKLHRRFRINLMQNCGDLDFNMAVGFRTLESGRLACISRGDTVINHDPARAGSRCPIASVVPYTPAMEAADRAATARMR
ncbi:MAG: hypothetical protein JO256_04550 [Alphaproteobacteria bacterium]|nr:hypothetical protein [Alphaproteobacteria bacterium]